MAIAYVLRYHSYSPYRSFGLFLRKWSVASAVLVFVSHYHILGPLCPAESGIFNPCRSSSGVNLVRAVDKNLPR